jgi:hypothetical protein
MKKDQIHGILFSAMAMNNEPFKLVLQEIMVDHILPVRHLPLIFL